MCISEHLQVVITRNTPTGATIFREDEHVDEYCFDELAREFDKKYPLSTWRYELFMMQQHKGKTMSFHINNLLEAADIAKIYKLKPDELLITLTLATCMDDILKQDLIKLDATSMQQV